MSGRVIMGDAIWTSKKIAALEPPSIRPEYVWLYPLAGVNGVFELDLRAIWLRCYAYGRPDKSLADIESILGAFESVGLLFTWDQSGKRWGFWTNSDKPGRRPRPAWIKRYAEKGKLGPEPPADALKAYLERPPARDKRATDTPLACSEHASDVTGLCLGTGTELIKPLRASKIGSHEAVFPPPPSKPSPEDETLDRTWGYYVEKLDKNPKILTFSALRKKKGHARLKEALGKTGGDLPKAEELLRIAIDHLAASPFHCGDNKQKTRYDSWEKNLFTSQEQFEVWLDKVTEAAS